MWYFMLQIITRALELKEERKDSKQIKNEKYGPGCLGMGRIQQIGSSLDAAAFSIACHGIQNGRKLVVL